MIAIFKFLPIFLEGPPANMKRIRKLPNRYDDFIMYNDEDQTTKQKQHSPPSKKIKGSSSSADSSQPISSPSKRSKKNEKRKKKKETQLITVSDHCCLFCFNLSFRSAFHVHRRCETTSDLAHEDYRSDTVKCRFSYVTNSNEW